MAIKIYIINQGDDTSRVVNIDDPIKYGIEVNNSSNWSDINRLLVKYECTSPDTEDDGWEIVQEFATPTFRCAEFMKMPGNYRCLLVVENKG
jgi:hypothetical protein